MKEITERITAKLFSDKAPEQEYLERFERFVKRKYGEETALEWVRDTDIKRGFRLEVGTHIYDWSEKGLLSQLDKVC